MRHLVLILLVVVVLAIGAPYAALLLDIAQGTWSASGIERDGSVTHMVFDRSLRPPQWLAALPGATVVQASQVLNPRQGRDVSFFDLASHKPMPEIRDFYAGKLHSAGFKVVDRGIAPLNAATADYLGIADQLEATRSATDDAVAVVIHTPEGVFRVRTVELRWWRNISKAPRR